MAWRMVWKASLGVGTDLRVSNAKGFATAVALCRRAAPLGPMPNEDIDMNDPEARKTYNSFTRYLKVAEEAKNKKCWWRTYTQRLKEANGHDGDAPLVNIGLPCCRPPRKERVKERNRLRRENRRNPELEKATRLLTFNIPLDRVKSEWERGVGPRHTCNLARHYAVFRDLFPGAYFLPRVMLRVAYGGDGAHVHYGNHVTPTEALSAPSVSFEADDDSLWTLLLTSPDEHLQENEGEYIHWLVGNIPGSSVQLGEELCHYLPPFPAKGTGFHRFIFILFKQEGLINFQEELRPSPCHSLKQRTFKTVEFYRKHQDVMTPAGLAFFQSQWDESVTVTFHRLLSMKEPVFQFVRPPVYHPPQKVYPHRQPLRYLDRYRDGHVPTYGIY